jgi:hypothetical protein
VRGGVGVTGMWVVRVVCMRVGVFLFLIGAQPALLVRVGINLPVQAQENKIKLMHVACGHERTMEPLTLDKTRAHYKAHVSLQSSQWGSVPRSHRSWRWRGPRSAPGAHAARRSAGSSAPPPPTV